MSLTIYLVACCKDKREGLHPASDSTWFRLARLYVEQQIAKDDEHRDWFILSAKHGLLGWLERIESYDQSLLDMERGSYLDWLYRIQRKLCVYGYDKAHFVILAGKEYRADLQHWLLHRGCTVEVPMQGLEIGEQLAWLKRETNAALQMGMEFPEVQR
jgi:hypothetical protein